MHFVNCTPHELFILTGEGEGFALSPSASVARVKEVRTDLDPVGDVPVTQVSYEGLTGLPEQVEGRVYVVSNMVREALKGSRPDVYSPGPLVRDEAGFPVGCRGLTAP